MLRIDPPLPHTVTPRGVYPCLRRGIVKVDGVMVDFSLSAQTNQHRHIVSCEGSVRDLPQPITNRNCNRAGDDYIQEGSWGI